MNFHTRNNIGADTIDYCIHLFKTSAKDRAITVSKPRGYTPKMSLRCLRWFKNKSILPPETLEVFNLNHLRHLRGISVGNESTTIVSLNPLS
jgi:hypothetical protein